MDDNDIEVNVDYTNGSRPVIDIIAPPYENYDGDPAVMFFHLTTNYTTAEGEVVSVQNGCAIREKDAAGIVAALLAVIHHDEEPEDVEPDERPSPAAASSAAPDPARRRTVQPRFRSPTDGP